MNHESRIVMCIFGELTAVTGSDKTPWPWVHDTCTPWKREWMNIQYLTLLDFSSFDSSTLSVLRFWTMAVSFKCLSLCVASVLLTIRKHGRKLNCRCRNRLANSIVLKQKWLIEKKEFFRVTVAQPHSVAAQAEREHSKTCIILA